MPMETKKSDPGVTSTQIGQARESSNPSSRLHYNKNWRKGKEKIMTVERKQKLVQEIIASVVCSEVWDKEQSSNPEVIIASKKMEGLLLAVRQYAPTDLMDKLESSIYEYTGAYERASLLNGLHVADALREVAARPSNLAELISAKLKENRANATEAQQ